MCCTLPQKCAFPVNRERLLSLGEVIAALKNEAESKVAEAGFGRGLFLYLYSASSRVFSPFHVMGKKDVQCWKQGNDADEAAFIP